MRILHLVNLFVRIITDQSTTNPCYPMPSFESPNGPIYFEQRGSRADPPLLLIHGLGCQLIHWPDSLLDGFVDSGFRVIVFDNRDIGLSFKVDAKPPSVADLLVAQTDPAVLVPAYSLTDMAEDVIHLLNHIGQSGAHLIGVSMGGMIAQRLVLNHPHRVFSVTSAMSTTGEQTVGQAEPEAIGALVGSFVLEERDAIIQATINAGNLFAGDHYPSEEHGIARFAEKAYERSHRPDGTLRQICAILTDGDRSSELGNVDVPMLVIHGTNDPLVHYSGSEAIASLVPGSKLCLIEKLGHDISEPIVPQLVELIVEHMSSASAPR